jgi:hypothetical protein
MRVATTAEKAQIKILETESDTAAEQDQIAQDLAAAAKNNLTAALLFQSRTLPAKQEQDRRDAIDAVTKAQADSDKASADASAAEITDGNALQAYTDAIAASRRPLVKETP